MHAYKYILPVSVEMAANQTRVAFEYRLRYQALVAWLYRRMNAVLYRQYRKEALNGR